MIEEDYVSFEIAKLLKEKGFDEYTGRCFVGEEWESPSPLTNSKLPDGRYSRPTLQMAMKWLREVHKVDIDIRGYWGLTPKYHIKNYMFKLHYVNAPNHSINKKFSSYEEACEAAIKYCLENLI